MPTKLELILDAHQKHPDWHASKLAEHVGCSVTLVSYAQEKYGFTPPKSKGNRPEVTKVCLNCGAQFSSIWMRQKYCSSCAPDVRRGLSRRDQNAIKSSKSDALLEIERTRGKQVTSLLDHITDEEEWWSVHYYVPYSLASSKNRRWSLNGKNGVFLTASVRDYQNMVIAATKSALRNQKIVQNKLWISFYVEKENNQSDAINVIDTLCDAIKQAVGLDDRWFCIGFVDWCIKKRDPVITIRISQKSKEDVIACSHCGELKGLDHFGNKSGMPFGKDRVCRPCKSILGKHRALARKRAPRAVVSIRKVAR